MWFVIHPVATMPGYSRTAKKFEEPATVHIRSPDHNAGIRCDLWCLENWTPPRDFRIMFLTFIKRDDAA